MGRRWLGSALANELALRAATYERDETAHLVRWHDARRMPHAGRLRWSWLPVFRRRPEVELLRLGSSPETSVYPLRRCPTSWATSEWSAPSFAQPTREPSRSPSVAATADGKRWTTIWPPTKSSSPLPPNGHSSPSIPVGTAGCRERGRQNLTPICPFPMNAAFAPLSPGVTKTLASAPTNHRPKPRRAVTPGST
jgi:hypothetical protein